MKILVTGGAGYIGAVLVPELLWRGHYVTVWDDLRYGGHGLLGVLEHPNLILWKRDIRERPCLPQFDVVIHLAALVGEPICSKNPSETMEINLYATQRLVESARNDGVKHFIFASTCSNYGKLGPDEEATEETPLQPISLYAESKVKAEEVVLAAQCDEFKTTVLRFATVYGLSPRMRFDLLLNELARDAVMTNWILLYGLDSWRPFVHIRDVMQAVSNFAERHFPDNYQVYNVGGHNLQKKEIAKMLKQLVPELEVEIKEGKKDPRNYRVNFSEIKWTGFSALYTPEDGLALLVRAVRLGIFEDVYSSRYRNA